MNYINKNSYLINSKLFNIVNLNMNEFSALVYSVDESLDHRKSIDNLSNDIGKKQPDL